MTDNPNRIPPTPKPAKDPNRPRPAHKLKLRNGDVVRLEGWQDNVDDGDTGVILTVGSGRYSDWIQEQIDYPFPKGERPLFTVVSRANGSS